VLTDGLSLRIAYSNLTDLEVKTTGDTSKYVNFVVTDFALPWLNFMFFDCFILSFLLLINWTDGLIN
jgi:hypothetical protein